MAVQPIRVAIIDLYNKHPNQGMRCIQDLLLETDGLVNGVPVKYTIYDLRAKGDAPGLDYDIYISTGGPGSPYDGVDTAWERDYFTLMTKLWEHNQKSYGSKKYVFFICHSFQMMCRLFELAVVTRRRSPAFGIFPAHKTEAGRRDALFHGLPDPFYVADFRSWQSVQPNKEVMEELGAQILMLEKIRPHVHYERALMAIRLSPEMVGTQFHPEADPASMLYHFQQPERKQEVIAEHGEGKYTSMIQHLTDPGNIPLTRNTILPNFLHATINALRPELVPVIV